MKKLAIIGLAAGLLMLSGAGLAQQQADKNIPPLTGKWEGECQIYKHGRGFLMNEKVTYYFKKQMGNLFYGTKTWSVKGKPFSEDFAGSINDDWEIQIAEVKDGTSTGKLMASGVMVLEHMEPDLVMHIRVVKVDVPK